MLLVIHRAACLLRWKALWAFLSVPTRKFDFTRTQNPRNPGWCHCLPVCFVSLLSVLVFFPPDAAALLLEYIKLASCLNIVTLRHWRVLMLINKMAVDVKTFRSLHLTAVSSEHVGQKCIVSADTVRDKVLYFVFWNNLLPTDVKQ